MTETGFEPRMTAAEIFRVGDVVTRSVSVFWRNFIWIVPVAVIPTVFLAPALLNQAALEDKPQMDPTLALEIVAGLLIYVLLAFWAQTTISHLTVEDLRGRKIHIGASLYRGFARLPPVIGLLILMSLGIGLGFVLLVVPGLILAFMWYVALPICVVEGLGPIDSLTRSASLTKGHRWAMVGVWALTIVANLVILFVVGAVVASLSMALGMTMEGAGRFLPVAIQLIGQAISSGFSAVLLAVAYFALRQFKDGVDTDRLAPVFD